MSTSHVRERRQFDRIGKSCPVWFAQGEAHEIKARTVNISDGGLLCRVREDEVPWHVGDFVRMRLNIPRETPSTFFLEILETDGRVIRFEVPDDRDGHLIALAFHPRLDLQLH
jgi:hypothetical protein